MKVVVLVLLLHNEIVLQDHSSISPSINSATAPRDLAYKNWDGALSLRRTTYLSGPSMRIGTRGPVINGGMRRRLAGHICDV